MSIPITTNWSGVVQEAQNLRKAVQEKVGTVPSGWHESVARDLNFIILDALIGCAIQLSRIVDAINDVNATLKSSASPPVPEHSEQAGEA